VKQTKNIKGPENFGLANALCPCFGLESRYMELNNECRDEQRKEKVKL
jgi:hypothetical protein